MSGGNKAVHQEVEMKRMRGMKKKKRDEEEYPLQFVLAPILSSVFTYRIRGFCSGFWLQPLCYSRPVL